MVTHIYNKYGDIISYIEWERVNERKRFDSHGSHLHVLELFVCRKYRVNLEKILKEYCIKVNTAGVKYIFWKRRKKNFYKCYKIERILKYGK